MAAQSQRRLVERWFSGLTPKAWEAAQPWIATQLKSLERVLGVLHQAVEYPPPSVELAIACSANTAITTTTDTAITGCTYTFTPDVDMRVIIDAFFDVQCSLFGAATHIFTGRLYVNGTVQTTMLPMTTYALDARTPVSGPWVIACASGTQYTFELQARTNNVLTQFSVRTPHTRFTVRKVPNTFRMP